MLAKHAASLDVLSGGRFELGIGASRLRGEGLAGGADEWIVRLADWATELGIDTFVFWPEGGSVALVEAFGRQVAPGVRAEVDRRRQAG